MKNLASSCKLRALRKCRRHSQLAARSSQLAAGFTLIETLVAVTLLTIAIGAPMSLTSKSLATAYYSRDQITAFHLAQEAIESIRHERDNNILTNVFGTYADLLEGIPNTTGAPFIVDTRDDSTRLCLDPEDGPCPPLQTDGELYGYRPGCIMPTTDCANGEGWENSIFTRTVRAEFVSGNPDEVNISVEVVWRTGSFQIRTISLSANLYRWIQEVAP